MKIKKYNKIKKEAHQRVQNIVNEAREKEKKNDKETFVLISKLFINYPDYFDDDDSDIQFFIMP